MAENKRDAVTILNDLIQSLKDAEIGFSEASKDVREEEYNKLFRDYSKRMGEFASALREQVKKVGGKPSDAGTMTGQVHRTWIHIRSMLNLHHAGPVLLESGKVEESLLHHYEKAVEELPADQKETVENQFVELIEIRDRIADLVGKGHEPVNPEGKKLLT